MASGREEIPASQIVVAGDSAGGGLALALCLYAKDHGLPLPAGIITMSPWTDVSLSGASYEENYTIDPLFGNSKENMLYQCSYIGNANPKIRICRRCLEILKDFRRC